MEEINKHFPFKNSRPGQKETIKKVLDAFSSGKKFVLMEGPTGIGKSAIGHTVSKFFNKSLYITIQKSLQDQLMTSFPEIIDLKGRNSYNCIWHTLDNVKISKEKRIQLESLKPSCAEGECKKQSKSICKECKPSKQFPISPCPYWERVGEFINAKHGLMNFKSFLYQTSFSAHFKDYKCDLMVIDECHNTEDQLLSFVSLTISDFILMRDEIKLPRFSYIHQYLDWLEEIEFDKKMKNRLKIATLSENTKEINEYESLLTKYYLMKISVKDNEWVCNYEKKKNFAKVEFKPIFVKQHSHKLIFNKADKVLMMSATIISPEVMIESLDINKDDVEIIRLESRFPKENRPINLFYAGSMSYKNKIETFPKIIEFTSELMDIYSEQKGIIHTHNFEIMNKLLDRLPKKHTSRLLDQRNFCNKTEMIEHHSMTDEPTVIIGPALHEGLDLKDDLSRFQILCKMPFPNFKDDPQLRIRKEKQPKYYDFLVMLKLVQSIGRSVRSETDYADTYILDSDFDMILRKNRDMMPNHILESLQY